MMYMYIIFPYFVNLILSTLLCMHSMPGSDDNKQYFFLEIYYTSTKDVKVHDLSDTLTDSV